MLKSFIYLNEPVLDSYLSSLEDGLRESVASRNSRISTAGGKAGAFGLNAQGQVSREHEESTTRSDTPSARFERLQKLARADQEASGWVDVVNPDDDLDGIGTGALIEIECEVYIPEIVRALSKSGGLASAIGQLDALMPLMPALSSETTELPTADQLEAVKGLTNAMGADLMFVGEPTDGEWRIAGKLLDQHLSGEVEGYVRVVGKVSTQWGPGHWKPLLALPGMNLMSREQRRQMERKGPDKGQEDNWLQGPAIMLDVLAIYR